MITNNYKNILIKFGLWLGVGIFLMFYGITHSLALTYTNLSELRDVSVVLVSSDATGNNAPINVPVNATYNLYDVFQVDYIISNYNFEANKNYQLESHLPNQVFTNVNYYSVSASNGDTCLISYENSILNNNNYPRWAFQCPRPTNSVTITIKNSSNEYLWPHNDTNIFTWQTALLKYSDSSLSGSGSDTDNIINNNNQNTQNIINNQDKNAQDIINNQNKNSQDIQNTINDNFNTTINCENLFQFNLIEDGNIYAGLTAIKEKDGSYTFSGDATSNFLNLSNKKYFNSRINILSKQKIRQDSYYVYNNSDYTISYNNNNNITSIYLTKDKYYNFNVKITMVDTITHDDYLLDYCEYGTSVVTNKLDQQNNAINNLDSTLKDDSVDDNGVADAFDSFNDFLDDNSTITQLITLPIILYTAILNNLNGTCSPFNLGKLYGEDLILPCINISQYLGNSLWTMIDIIISGFAVYAISKKMIKVFNNFSSLREGDVIDD